MLASAAMMVLAVYWKPSVPPDTGLNPPMTIQEDQKLQRATAQPANPEEQTTGDGTVQDRNDTDQTDAGLTVDPEAGDRVVIPRE
ncbi:MAG: hypothetical protein K0U37_01835 [Gammaproteobacteria bacterium]|nr:hypothetical protein [Gammaproteobacteria bacterium]